jgi:serine/threonine protein kinase
VSFQEKYLIQKELGGAKIRKFSRVFKAIKKTTGEEVVLKTLTKNSTNHIAQERLKAEATFSFSKQGLPNVLDYFESENEQILVKTFEKGIPLNTYLNRFKPKQRAFQLIPIIEQLIPLFQFIHEQNIVHLDIKPSNILVDVEENQLAVSLIDFGMAYRMHSNEQRSILFPLGYAAPECLLNQLELVDRRSDYFSFGISIWQCIEGKLPLLHANPSITTNLQLTHPLPEGVYLNKRQYQSLKKLTEKHAFALPPNKMNVYDVKIALEQARNSRYPDLTTFLNDWSSCSKEQKSWFSF